MLVAGYGELKGKAVAEAVSDGLELTGPASRQV